MYGLHVIAPEVDEIQQAVYAGLVWLLVAHIAPVFVPPCEGVVQRHMVMAGEYDAEVADHLSLIAHAIVGIGDGSLQLHTVEFQAQHGLQPHLIVGLRGVAPRGEQVGIVGEPGSEAHLRRTIMKPYVSGNRCLADGLPVAEVP